MRDRAWRPNAIVFLSNACVMIIELVAGRILAPRIGVSLYTWTSIIGVVLGGISLGNYLGGRLADRQPSWRLLGSVFLAAAVLTIAIVPLSSISGGMMAWGALPLVARIIVITTVSFFLPAMVLGMISPIVVRLSLETLEKSGNTVGQIYASSALGSIVGTFLTGFLLISLFGVYQILLAVAIGLTALGLVVGGLARRQLTVATAIVVVATFLGVSGHQNPLCTMETNYFCLRLVQTDLNGRPGTALMLDRMVHSVVDPANPGAMQYPYDLVVAAAVERTMPADGQFSALVLGGGGFAVPRYLEVTYPSASVSAVEIDSGVVKLARDQGWLPADSRIDVATKDARLYMDELAPGRRFDFVFGDVFNDYAVPYHLTTREFATRVNDHLSPDGIYLVNMVDGSAGNWTFLRAMVTTLGEVFPHVYVVPVREDWRTLTQPPPTIEVIASRRALDLSDLPVQPWSTTERPGRPLSEDELAAVMNGGKRTVLTDQFAPTDTMLAPVFGAALR